MLLRREQTWGVRASGVRKGCMVKVVEPRLRAVGGIKPAECRDGVVVVFFIVLTGALALDSLTLKSELGVCFPPWYRLIFRVRARLFDQQPLDALENPCANCRIP